MTGPAGQDSSTDRTPPRVFDAWRDRTMLAAMAILALSVILAAAAYLPGLGGPLVLDDLPQLGGLIGESATDPALLFNNHLVSTSGPLGRPVSMATFILDAVSHGPDTWWWKYQNLLIHLAAGLLVAWLTALLAAAATERGGSRPWLFGAVVASLWLLHPLQVSTVLYTVQRMTELSALFVLAGLVSYVKGRNGLAHSAWRGWLLIGLGFGLFWPLAVLSKESALLYPVYCSIIELLVLRFRGAGHGRQPLRAFHGALLGAYLLAGAFVLLNFPGIVLDGYDTRDFTLVERGLTQFRVLATYLVQGLLPAQRRMAFFHDDVLVSTGLLSPATTLVSLLFLCGLLFAAIRFRNALPLFAFGVLFFFASHLLESTIFPLELMFEHRNYLGLAGIMIAAASLVPIALRQGRLRVAVGVLAIAGLSGLTWARAQTWASPAEMYVYMYLAHPESPRLNLVFANIHANAGDFGRAREALARVGDDIGPAVHRLFFDCLERGRIDSPAISAATAVRTGIVDAHATSSLDSIVAAVTGGRCSAPAEGLRRLFDHLENLPPRAAADARALLLAKARYLESVGDADAAVDVLVSAAGKTGDDALPLFLAAGVLVDDGRPGEAAAMLDRAYGMERNIRIRRSNLAEAIYPEVAAALLLGGSADAAMDVYRQAMTAMPGYSLSYVRLAELLLASGRKEDAADVLARLRARPPADLDRYEYLLSRLAVALERGPPDVENSTVAESR